MVSSSRYRWIVLSLFNTRKTKINNLYLKISLNICIVWVQSLMVKADTNLIWSNLIRNGKKNKIWKSLLSASRINSILYPIIISLSGNDFQCLQRGFFFRFSLIFGAPIARLLNNFNVIFIYPRLVNSKVIFSGISLRDLLKPKNVVQHFKWLWCGYSIGNTKF